MVKRPTSSLSNDFNGFDKVKVLGDLNRVNTAVTSPVGLELGVGHTFATSNLDDLTFVYSYGGKGPYTLDG